MLYIGNDNSIKLTRGDTAYISVPITNDLTGNAYNLAETDKLTLTVKKRATDTEALFKKTAIGSNDFHILPSDTSDLAFGKYLYDVQLETPNGDVYTVIVPSDFEVLKEVTW